MNKLSFSFDQINFSQKTLTVFGLSLTAIIATRLYFRGGICKAEKDLSGKIAVITGGNTGIGKETVIELAKRNCKIILGARDRVKSE
jgi:hypothetical protein